MEIAYDQILLLLLQCLIIALLLASLFRLRSIFGLSLLYIALGVFQFLQVFLASSLLIEVSSGIFISSGSMVLFSASLFMVLLIYIREDALETRKIIYALLAANLVTSLLLVVFGWSIDNDVVTNLYNLPREFFSNNARILLVGTAIFLIDAFAIIFMYEFISKYVKPLFFRILFTMTLVLSLDSLLFALGIFYGKLEFQNILISGLIAKNLAAVIYSSLFTLYLVYFDTKLIKSETEADTFKDIFHKLTFRQKYEDVFTEMKNKSIELEEAQKMAQLGTVNLDLTTMLFSSSPIFDSIFEFNLEKTKKFVTYQQTVHPDDLPENKIRLANCIKTGKKFDREYRIFTKNKKKLKWIHGMGEVIYIKGEPAFFKGTVQDITKQKLAEKKLQLSEEKFSKAYVNNPIPIFMSSIPDGEFIDINSRFEQISGRSRKELIGKKVTDLGFYANKQDRLKLFKEIENKGRLQGYEIEFKAKSGEIRDCKMYSEIIDIDGVPCLISIVRDITEQKQSKLALEKQNKELISLSTELSKKHNLLIESEKQFKNLFDKSPVSLWEEDFAKVKHLLDKKMTETSDLRKYLDENPDFVFECVSKVEILNVNNISLDLFGVNNTEELINHLSKTFNDKSIEIFKEELLAIASNKKEFSSETEFIRNDGEIINALINFLIIDDNYEKAIVSIVDITSRKQAELSLIESENELRHSQEIAQLGSFNFNISTQVFVSSPIFDAIVGFNAGDKKTLETYKEMVHPDDFVKNGKMLEECIKTSKKFDREYRILNYSTKELIWLHGFGDIVSGERNEIHFKGTIQNITERKLNELAIRLNEEKLIETQKIANLGTYEIDLKTNDIATSELYNTILSINKRPENNKGWWKSIVHPEDFEQGELLWEECIREGKKYDDEYRITTDNDKIKWIHDIAEVKYENGKPAKVVGTIQDITQRKVNEKIIRRSDAILNQLNSLVKVVDKHGNITYASPSFKTILGYETEEILGQGWWIKTTPDLKSAKQLRDSMIKIASNNDSLSSEIRNSWIKTKQGKNKLIDWVSSRGDGGSLIFTGIDVTEREIAEKNSAQYWKIVENSLNEIFIFDADTLKFIEVNRGARKNIGYTSKELSKMTPVDIKPLITKRKFNELLKPLKNNTKEKIIFTSEHQRKNGTTYIAEVNIQKSELKLKPVFIASIKDVTQQQKNEQIKQVIFNITKKSNESIGLGKLFNFIRIELGKLINTNNFFITIYDEKSDMLFTPYMVDEIDDLKDFPKGKTLTGHVIDTKKALLTKNVIIENSSNNQEVIGLGPESKCWLGVPILIDDQAIGAIVVQSYTDENAYNEEDVILLELIASNIGQIIRKSEDLEQIRLLKQALIHTPAIMMITNKKVKLEYINPSFTSITGYKPHEVLGKNPMLLNPEINIKEFYSKVEKKIILNGYWNGEIINIKKDGSRMIALMSIAPVKDNKGNITHYIIVEEDITEKRKLERQFINAIIEAQDIEKQNFGEELHDGISQILSAESMYIDLLIEQNQDRINDKAKFLTKIKELNSSAINETRNIAHGLMSSQLKQSGLLMSVENICIDFSNKRNIEFKFVNDGVDEKDLSQEIKTNLFRVIQELSTNINRYSNATKAIISFSKLNKNSLKIIVKDNGIGVDYNKIKNEATGIGLETVKRRVTYLNGNFDLESALNEGTCYTLEIPL